MCTLLETRTVSGVLSGNQKPRSWDVAAKGGMPYLVAGLTALAVVSRPLRVLASALLVPVAVASRRTISHDSRSKYPFENREKVRVVSANVLYKNKRCTEAASMLTETDADVLVLVEHSERIRQFIPDSVYPYRVIHESSADDRATEISVLSKTPLEQVGLVRAYHRTFPLLSTTVNGAPLLVIPVHTMAPHRKQDKITWEEEMAGLLEHVKTIADPLVVCGDFNATLTHAPMARLLDHAPLRSAMSLMKKGWVPTWGPLGVVPVLALDHVLVSPEVIVLKAQSVRTPGSDHRCVVADMTIPRSA